MSNFIASALSGRTRLVTHISGWTLVFITFFYLLRGIRGPSEAMMRTIMNMAFLMALFYGNAKVLVNHFLEKGRYGLLVLLALIFWLGMAGLRTWVELHLFGGSIFTSAQLPADGGARMFMAFAGIYLVLLVFSTLYQLLENRHLLELHHHELEARHAEARLSYLKAQINPHFLFNTLNNIYAAATLQHPRTADMVLRLSDLLRYVTYDAQAVQVPLEKEIAHIRAYLELFQLKSQDSLPIRFEVLGDVSKRIIEPVLLLPLVENALKHGDLEENPSGFVHLELTCSQQGLSFRVSNSFNPENRQKDAVGGVGLENIRQRLALNYAGRHRLETSFEDHTFVAFLELKLS